MKVSPRVGKSSPSDTCPAPEWATPGWARSVIREGIETQREEAQQCMTEENNLEQRKENGKDRRKDGYGSGSSDSSSSDEESEGSSEGQIWTPYSMQEVREAREAGYTPLNHQEEKGQEEEPVPADVQQNTHWACAGNAKRTATQSIEMQRWRAERSQ